MKLWRKKEELKRKVGKTDNNENRAKQLKLAKNGNEMMTLTVAKSLPEIQVDFNKKLVKWITDTPQPFSAVEIESFQKMIAAVNPSLRIMSRKTLMSYISEVKNDGKR